MSLSRTCQLNVCVIFLLFQWPSLPLSLSAGWPVCDKLEHALESFAYYISTKNSWRPLFTNSEQIFHFQEKVYMVAICI